MDEPQEIWQNQKAEEIRMSTNYFKLKAEQQRSKVRRRNASSDLAALAVIGFLGYLFTKVANPVSRIGLVLEAAVWVYGTWLRHGERASQGPPAAGVEAYVHELERSRDEARDMLKVLALLVPGALLFAIPLLLPNPRVLMNALPFCVLLAVWLILVFPVRRRRMRELQREIDMLKQ